VYLGLDVLNARLRARNFTAQTLAHLVPYAHSRNVKVYVTLNTLVKQAELPLAADILHQMSQIGVDALIVADLGLIRMAHRYVPRLCLHGSTQMFLHNSLGLDLAHRLGLTRVILPRELTLEEIASIKRHSTVEIEVFGHGALCYSFSGLCLASSYLGGGSGNRGRCTQVCRRKFQSEYGAGHFFSPRDLETIEFIPRFIEMGIAGLKIEGRMRSPEYVHTVVSAYRRAIDTPRSIPSLVEELAYDMGRPKTRFFLWGVRQENVIDSKESTGTGVPLGAIRAVREGAVVLATPVAIEPGDQIRIHPQSGFAGVSAKVAGVRRENDDLTLAVTDSGRFHPGDAAYLISRRAVRARVSSSHRVNVTPVRFSQSAPWADRAIREQMPGSPPGRNRLQNVRLLVKIDSAEWLASVSPASCDALVLALPPGEMNQALGDRAFVNTWTGRFIPSLPAFIAEGDVDVWRDIVKRLGSLPAAGWMCGHASQRSLLPVGVPSVADYTVWCLNRQAQSSLRDMGFSAFCHSLEDDFPNQRAQASPDGFAYVFAQVPLFVSRIRPDAPGASVITDTADKRFQTANRYGMHFLLSGEPYCLFHRLGKLREAGIDRFIIDLSFCRPYGRLVEDLIAHFRQEKKLEHSAMFNFKLGLH
jgi:U32 family peptidase